MTAIHPSDAPTYYKAPPELSRYRAGTDGTIWSAILRDTRGRRRARCWQRLSPCIAKSGHLAINLATDTRGWCRFLVHRLVLLAFVGPCPEGMECCHNDGDPLNNRLDNLRWDTRSANIADAIKHGGYPIGMRSVNALLCDQDIPRIRSMLAAGVVRRVIAERFGVKEGTINNIARGDTWKAF